MGKFNLLRKNTADKLFKTNSGIVEYVVIQEEFQNLFDYCLLIQEKTLEKLKSIKKESEKYQKEPNKTYEFDGIIFNNQDLMQGLTDFEIPNWEDILGFTVPMNQILLISILLEKSLKSLCSEYCPNNNSDLYGGYKVSIRKKKQKSTISSYIKYLEESCEIKISIDRTLDYLDQNLRKIRNSFVHGDWESVNEYAEKIDINKVFISTSVLFQEIESKYCSKTSA